MTSFTAKFSIVMLSYPRIDLSTTYGEDRIVSFDQLLRLLQELDLYCDYNYYQKVWNVNITYTVACEKLSNHYESNHHEKH